MTSAVAHSIIPTGPPAQEAQASQSPAQEAPVEADQDIPIRQDARVGAQDSAQDTPVGTDVPIGELLTQEAACDLAVEYLGVADALARRFRCPGHDPDDLRQVARLGLMKAAHRYRNGSGHGFVPYAVPTIAGEIKRYLRDQSWVVRPPRSVQELRLKVNALRPGLTQSLGHEPTTRELSTELNVPLEDVAEAQIANASMVSDPIEHGDASDEQDERRPAILVPCEDPGFDQVDVRSSLADALEDATDQDRELLRLRFNEELTQQEIATRLGVSQMQVSRLLRRLLSRLRRRMAA